MQSVAIILCVCSPQLSRKRPPPVAPKPVVFRMVTASGEVHYTVEPPSSFDEVKGV